MNIQERLSSISPSVGNTLFVAVDGNGGSGKSTLAKLLAKRLNAQIIQTDHFASWDNPLNWWPLAIQYVFQPIKNGAMILNYPRSKWTPKPQNPKTPIY
jgi:predicted ABC-type ATPase